MPHFIFIPKTLFTHKQLLLQLLPLEVATADHLPPSPP